MFYSGNVDGAISELEQSLKYDPKHPGALLNLGIIKWKAKNDVPGAVASWQKLLKLNPDFKQKSEVERLIAEARQGSKQLDERTLIRDEFATTNSRGRPRESCRRDGAEHRAVPW